MIAYNINSTQMKRLENIQKACLKRIYYTHSTNLEFKEFLLENKIQTIEQRRKNQILISLQKLKLNFNSVPKNWRKQMNFVQHLPTGRNGWRINCELNDDKIFYTYASKMYNNLDLNIRNNFTLNKFKELLYMA